MKLFKFIFWILIIGVIVLAIVKRNELIAFLEKFTHGDNSRTEVTVNKTTVQTESMPAAKEAAPKDETTEAPEAKPPVAGQDEVKTSAEQAPEAVKSDSAPTATEAGESQEAQKAQAPETPEPSETADSASAESATKDPDETWLHDRARQATQDKEYETALQAYQELVTKNPDQVEYWGELGDMFHVMGENRRAAQAYTNAAILYKRQGRDDLVQKIIPYIERYDSWLVEKIQDAR